jgi:TRAP-type C4-dicarboxylate transport system permease large subunit
MLAVAIYVRVRPDAATTAERVPYAQRLRTLASVWPVVVIFGLVMGGIAADWDWGQDGVQALFTPTEGAAVGAVATGLYGILTGGLTWKGFLDSVLATAQATAMIFFIVWGAKLFNSFLALTRAPDQLVTWIEASGYAPLLVLTIMLVAYLIFGCVMDSLSMILLTIPIFFPIIMSLEFVVLGHALSPEEAAIWFGILALIVVEVGLITPPVGMNLFIINSMARDIPMVRTYAGVAPFVASDLIRVVILVLFPGITLWLVGVLFG